MSAVYLPPNIRARVYLAYGLFGLILGATQVGYAAAEAGQPVALTVALAVFAFLGTGLGYTAASHTDAPADEPDDFDGDVEPAL